MGNDSVTAVASTKDSVTIDTGAGDDVLTLSTANGAADGSFVVNNFTGSDSVTVDFDNGAVVLSSALSAAKGSGGIVVDSGATGQIVLNGATNLSATNFTNSTVVR